LSEWQFADADKTERFAQHHYFSMVKVQGDREIEFVITVKEYLSPMEPTMKFFAEADKQTNQKTAAFTPCGWGGSLLIALSECMRAVRRFPYEGD